MKARISLLSATALLLTLAACGGNGGVTRGIASLGQGFVAAFNADRNGDPVSIKNIPLTVDPSADPFNP